MQYFFNRLNRPVKSAFQVNKHDFPKHICGLFLGASFVLLLTSMKCLKSNDLGMTYERFIGFFQLAPHKIWERPWTLFTYVVALPDPYRFLFHAVLQLIFLYSISSIVSEVFSYRQLVWQSILSTIVTGLLLTFILSEATRNSSLIKTDGCFLLILSYVIATAVYTPHHKVNFLIFRMPLYLLALLMTCEVLLNTAVSGYDEFLPELITIVISSLYGIGLRIMRHRRGTTRRIKFYPEQKSSGRAQQGDMKTVPRQDLSDLDAILRKVSKEGYHMLTAEEKRILYDGSK